MRKSILRDGADCVKNKKKFASGRQEGRPRVRVASAAALCREEKNPVEYHGRGTAQLLYFMSGHGRILTGDRSFLVGEDDLVAINPNQEYVLDCPNDPVRYFLLELDGVFIWLCPAGCPDGGLWLRTVFPADAVLSGNAAE